MKKKPQNHRNIYTVIVVHTVNYTFCPWIVDLNRKRKTIKISRYFYLEYILD